MGSPRSLAARVLAYSAMHDRRDPGEDELLAWTAAIANAQDLTEKDLKDAVDSWNRNEGYPNPKPRDIVPLARRLRRRRLGLDRFARRSPGVKPPKNFREMVEAEKARFHRLRLEQEQSKELSDES